MSFTLRRRLPLPPGRVLFGGYPHLHSARKPLLLSITKRPITSQSTPSSTHVASCPGFPPLPESLPQPPAYPCPHLANFDALKPLYQRHWKVCASYNNARDVRTIALEKKFTLTKYRHTLEFFNDVMDLQGICAQEKVNPSYDTSGSRTDIMTWAASPNWRTVYVHYADVHLEDLECCLSPVSAG